jgi:hypothetical protein
VKKKQKSCCQVCSAEEPTGIHAGMEVCSSCRGILETIEKRPEIIKTLWQKIQDEPILLKPEQDSAKEEIELPEVLDGKRYRAIDRDQNKWYLSISEVNNRPVEVFASTAFDRDHELQSRISNLTTITRLISLILRHIFLNERLTLEKCLKQIKRSSRNKNDLPDMLHGVLSRYSDLP